MSYERLRQESHLEHWHFQQQYLYCKPPWICWQNQIWLGKCVWKSFAIKAGRRMGSSTVLPTPPPQQLGETWHFPAELTVSELMLEKCQDIIWSLSLNMGCGGTRQRIPCRWGACAADREISTLSTMVFLDSLNLVNRLNIEDINCWYSQRYWESLSLHPWLMEISIILISITASS